MKPLERWRRLRNTFLTDPLPDAVFQLTSRALTGLRVFPHDRETGASFIAPIPAGSVNAFFDRKNIEDPPLLETKLKEGMRKLGLSKGTVAVLLPEPCVRVFLLHMESFPSSPKERDAVLRWRIAKQMPSFPDDARLVYRNSVSGGARKILAVIARDAVVLEYETLFSRCHLVPGVVAFPSIALINLVSPAEESFLTVNVEEDVLSFSAVVDSRPVLFRQKAFSTEGGAGIPVARRFGALLTEIENTIHFLEDKEKKQIRSVWLRPGLLDGEEDLAAEMGRLLSLPARETGSLVAGEASAREKNLLSPLYGFLM